MSRELDLDFRHKSCAIPAALVQNRSSTNSVTALSISLKNFEEWQGAMWHVLNKGVMDFGNILVEGAHLCHSCLGYTYLYLQRLKARTHTHLFSFSNLIIPCREIMLLFIYLGGNF